MRLAPALRTWTLAIVALLPGVLAAEESAVDEARIRHLVVELGASEFDVRERAQEELARIGEPARSLLEEAARGDDLEAAGRAAKILESMAFHFLRGGALEAWDAEIVERFLAGDEEMRVAAADDLANRTTGLSGGSRLDREVQIEARRVMRLVHDRSAKGNSDIRWSLLLMHMALLGEPQSLAEFAEAETDLAAVGIDTMELFVGFSGTSADLIDAIRRVAGAPRARLGEFLLWWLSRDRGEDGLTQEVRARGIEVARQIDPRDAPIAATLRGALLVRLGETSELADFLRSARALEARDVARFGREALADWHSPDRLAEILVLGSRFDEDIRETLASSVIGFFADVPPESLGLLLSHETPMVRECAAAAVGLHHMAPCLESLVPLLSDSDADVRLTAAWSLVEVGGEREQALTAVRPSLDAADAEEARDALWVLAQVGDVDVETRATELLGDERPDVRAAAAYALLRLSPMTRREPPVNRYLDLLSDEAPCRYFPATYGGAIPGTVGDAARAYLERWLDRELLRDPAAARTQVEKHRER